MNNTIIENAKKKSCRDKKYIVQFGNKKYIQSSKQHKAYLATIAASMIIVSSGVGLVGTNLITNNPHYQAFQAYKIQREVGLEKFKSIDDINESNITYDDLYTVYAAGGFEYFEAAVIKLGYRDAASFLYQEGAVKDGMPSIIYWTNVQEAKLIEINKNGGLDGKTI